MARHCSWPATTRRPLLCGTSPTRPTPRRSRSDSATRRPARPTPSCRCTWSRSMVRGSTWTGRLTGSWTATCSSTSPRSSGRDGAPLLALLTRDQRRLELREVDVATGSTTSVRVFTDDSWVELLPGTPRRISDGRLLHGLDDGETRRLAVDGVPFTPESLQVREVLGVEDDGVVASVVPRVASVSVARLGYDGSVTLLSDPVGVAMGAAGGDTVVTQYRTLAELTTLTTVTSRGLAAGTIEGHNETPPITLNLETMQVGSRDYPTTVLFPAGHVAGVAPAAGAHGPVRRAARAAGGERLAVLPVAAVAGRPGLRRHRGGRSWHGRPWAGLGPAGQGRLHRHHR